MPEDTGPRRIIIGVTLLIVVLLAFALARNLGDRGVYYLRVAEVLEGEEAAGQPTRVAGLINEESIDYREEEELLSFTVRDPGGENHLPVEYSGEMPEAITEQEQVVLEGSMEEEAFQAARLMFQCPSQYEEELENE